MNAQTIRSADQFAAFYYESSCARTGRKGIRPSFNGDVVAEEWRTPEGMTFWRETGHNADPRVGSYEGFRESFPEEKRIDMIGILLPNADPESAFYEPIGDWYPAQSSDWGQTVFYTATGAERAYPYNDVRYARCEIYRSAAGCNCHARYDTDAECICGDEWFEASHQVWWLKRVRKADGTPAWQECSAPEFAE
jgi:hypothetical protein